MKLRYYLRKHRWAMGFTASGAVLYALLVNMIYAYWLQRAHNELARGKTYRSDCKDIVRLDCTFVEKTVRVDVPTDVVLPTILCAGMLLVAIVVVVVLVNQLPEVQHLKELSRSRPKEPALSRTRNILKNVFDLGVTRSQWRIIGQAVGSVLAMVAIITFVFSLMGVNLTFFVGVLATLGILGAGVLYVLGGLFERFWVPMVHIVCILLVCIGALAGSVIGHIIATRLF